MDLAEPAAPAERIGAYEILLPIGKGGAATVYLARQSMAAGIHKDVAIKLMHPDLRASPDAANELIEEAKLAAAIRHPNVVGVFEAGDKSGQVFIAFEYIEGDTLGAVLGALRHQRRTLPPSIAIKILSDALAGLHAAHELRGPNANPVGLVHRDFSPQNILLGTDGITRLTDFGIAKALNRLSVTRTGLVKGKTGYMSPEQVRGEALDRRSDIWAAGVVAWEVIVGRRLFRGDEMATLAKIVADNPLARVRRFRPDVPSAVDEAIARALSKNPSERFDTAMAFRTALLKGYLDWAEPAEVEEVGRLVIEISETKLVERRCRAREMLELRGRMRRISNDAVIEERSKSSVSEGPSEKRQSRAWLIGPLVIAIAGVLVLAIPRAPSASVAPAPAPPSPAPSAESAADAVPIPTVEAIASAPAVAKKPAPSRQSSRGHTSREVTSDPNRIQLAPRPYRR